MFVDLTTGIDTQGIDRFGLAIHSEEDAPAANPGFANAGPVSERRRQARIEGGIGQLHKSSPNALFRRTNQPIENLLGFVSDANAKTHSPRSRSYSARGFTRPAARSARPRSREASDSGSSGGPSASAASRRSWIHVCASSAWSSGNSSTS